MRPSKRKTRTFRKFCFPFLLGGTFIEACRKRTEMRASDTCFPFLLGGTFIEAGTGSPSPTATAFPFLLGGTFIEAKKTVPTAQCVKVFPSFWEGLSLRQKPAPDAPWPHPVFPFLLGGTFIEAFPSCCAKRASLLFSLPFGRDFH